MPHSPVIALGAPLSDYAIGKLDRKKFDFTGTPLMFLIIGGIFWLLLGTILCASMVEGKIISVPVAIGVWFGFYVVACAWYMWRCHITAKSWWPPRVEVSEENLRDYNLAKNFQTIVQARFNIGRADEFSLQEKALDGDWRAFRVEHLVTQSLRGDFSGRIDLNLRSIFRSGGEVSAKLKQLATPDLLDMSSIVFFENGTGTTLRVLVPSPRATKEMIVALIETYAGEIPQGTHLRNALNQFTSDENLQLAPISHPVLIDRLSLAVSKPREERPLVQVIGKQIQEGVALCTALVVDGVKSVFLPSGFLSELGSCVGLVLDKDQQKPNLLETVR